MIVCNKYVVYTVSVLYQRANSVCQKKRQQQQECLGQACSEKSRVLSLTLYRRARLFSSWENSDSRDWCIICLSPRILVAIAILKPGFEKGHGKTFYLHHALAHMYARVSRHVKTSIWYICIRVAVCVSISWPIYFSKSNRERKREVYDI